MSEENAVDRRKLLRRAGTVAAGIGAAGVATAVTASPASATDGQPIVQGVTNTGAATTTVTSTASSTLTLSNTAADGSPGAPLTLPPRAWSDGLGDGAIVFDSYQSLNYAWGGLGKRAAVYDSSWVPQVYPTPPMRVLVTFTNPPIMDLATEYTMTGGKINPKGSPTNPDMVVDLTWALDPSTGLSGTAVQFNLTAFSSTPGWVAAWDEGDWPLNSSINTPANNQAIANFVQCAVGTDGKIRFKMSRPTALIIDILGFIAYPGNFAAQGVTTAKAAPFEKTISRLRNASALPRR
jgi:hypothetical protein